MMKSNVKSKVFLNLEILTELSALEFLENLREFSATSGQLVVRNKNGQMQVIPINKINMGNVEEVQEEVQEEESDLKSLDIEKYNMYIKSEYKLNYLLGLEEEPVLIRRNLSAIRKRFKALENEGEIERFAIDGNEIVIKSKKYDTHAIVLHSGHVYCYRINNQTKKKVHYDHRSGIYPENVVNMLEEFI